MNSRQKLKSNLSSLVFWSVISAAFIGPGTVTTASKAGASYGFSLLWALLFSTIACAILQEAAARVTIHSGLSLGEAIAQKFKHQKNNSFKLFIFAAILIGGIAYQAGNILGAVSGIGLLVNWSAPLITVLITVICALLLWRGNYRLISNVLGAVVALMGFSFCLIVIKMNLDWAALFQGVFIPSIPSGAEWIVIGLIGTTIVPYNLFLASGISHGQNIKTMRFGLVSAIMIGGMISSAILIAGSLVTETLTFENLREAVEYQLGASGGLLLAIGLFMAGFTSAVTAPLAAAITAKSLFITDNPKWNEHQSYYKIVWLTVLISGLIFGVSGVKPIPAIILAQAANGLLLPIACIYLIIIINDKTLMTPAFVPSGVANLLLSLVLLVTSFLGIINIYKLMINLFELQENLLPLRMLFFVALALTITVYFKTQK